MLIELATGYTVDTDKNDWPEHLTNALIGEIFIGAAGDGGPQGADGWDALLLALVWEIIRVCLIYGLHVSAWMPKVIIQLDEYLKEAGVKGMKN